MVMSKIEDKFNELEEKKEGALIGYLTLGDPNIEDSKELVKALRDRKSTRLNSSHTDISRMPSSA